MQRLPVKNIVLACAGLALAGCAVAPAAAPGSALVIPLDHLPVLTGQYFPIDSRETGHLYHIYISYPEGYGEQRAKRFPALYILDGDSLFPHLASNQRFLHYDDDVPGMLVVGIAYGSFEPPQNRRRHDFTVGADAFGRFLENELIPRVEQSVRADPARRMLLGQSRGGGFVLHSAFTRPDLFWGRIASNPTVDLLPSLLAAPAPASRRDLHLLVASGSLDDPQYANARADWLGRWTGRNDLPWTFRSETIEGGTHAADSARAHRLAMRWLFRAGPAAK